METGIKVVEEGVLRMLLPGVGIGKHSFGTGQAYLLAEIRQGYLLFIPEVLRHIGGAGIALIDRLVRRVKIKQGLAAKVLPGLPVVTVQDDDILQQLMVETDQFLFQQLYPSAEAESDGQFPAAVHRIDAVIAGAHKEDEQGGTGHVVRIPLIVKGALFHEVGFALCMFA